LWKNSLRSFGDARPRHCWKIIERRFIPKGVPFEAMLSSTKLRGTRVDHARGRMPLMDRLRSFGAVKLRGVPDSGLG
jgi:hypothetical protein